tara:strand:+ start:485 stop:1096 length:612 start_codon:yes stop_codon:yes gene_type:complete
MVNERVNVKDKHRVLKKALKIFGVILGILIILAVVFVFGFLLKKPAKIEVILANPLESIILANTNELGEVNNGAVIQEAVIEFDEEYINYLLVALGTGYLHKSILGGNPVIELVLGEGVWASEIIDGVPYSGKGEAEEEDLKISLSKEEAVRAILSSDIEQFMKDSVNNGNTQIEMIAGKTELFAKGYLSLYKALTGEEIAVE